MKALVTGGGGFLGRSIVEQLLARGDEVTVFSRGNYPQVAALGARMLRGDLQNAHAVQAACAGMDAVFHIAAKAGAWGDWNDYYGINVTGTANIITGCRSHHVPKLINCSSPSVIFDNDAHEGVAETHPYPTAYESHYPHTKALAEQLVTQANGPDLLTVSLRPHLIIGPRDNHLLPAVLAAARAKTLPRIGDGTNWVDMTNVEDAAQAFLLAADHLTPGSPLSGSTYFISQGEPVNLWNWLDTLLTRLEIPLPKLHLSLPVARFLAGAMETAYKALPLKGEPRFTRFLASELAISHWYDISRAKQDFGYSPRHTMAEVEDIIIAAFKEKPVG
jgi:nucleoside-diphosphate-sugar epimerase